MCYFNIKFQQDRIDIFERPTNDYHLINIGLNAKIATKTIQLKLELQNKYPLLDAFHFNQRELSCAISANHQNVNIFLSFQR